MPMLSALFLLEIVGQLPLVELVDEAVAAPKNAPFWTNMVIMHHPELANKDLAGPYDNTGVLKRKPTFWGSCGIACYRGLYREGS